VISQAELATLQAKLQQLKEIEQNSREITVQAELCSHEVTLLQTRVEQCAYAQANKEVEVRESIRHQSMVVEPCILNRGLYCSHRS